MNNTPRQESLKKIKDLESELKLAEEIYAKDNKNYLRMLRFPISKFHPYFEKRHESFMKLQDIKTKFYQARIDHMDKFHEIA